MSAPNTHACESRFSGEQHWRRGQEFPSFELASKAMKEVTDHLAVCPHCRAEIAETRIVELDAGGTFDAPSSLAAVAEQIKRTLETKLGADVRVFNIDDLVKPAPEPKAAPAPEPEEWGIFIDNGDGQGFLEDGGPRVSTKAEADRQGNMVASLLRLAGKGVPRWEARRVDIVTPAPEDAKVDVPAMLDKIASLEARVSTLVESEARAVAGEKAAREALAQAKAQPIQGIEALRALLASLEKNGLDRHADSLRMIIGFNTPKADAATTEPPAGVVDHGPNGVGC